MDRRRWIIYGSISAVVALIIILFFHAQHRHEDMAGNEGIAVVSYSDLQKMAHDHTLKSVNLSRVGNIQTAVGMLPDGRLFRSDAPAEIDLADKLSAEGVKVTVPVKDPKMIGEAKSIYSTLGTILLQALIFGLVQLLVFVFGSRLMMKGMRGGKKYKFKENKENKVYFKDIAGIDDVLEEMKDIVNMMKSPEKNRDELNKCPGGVLFLGPPGVGKTMIAKAIATEAGIPFFQVSGSEFVEVFVGMGAARVRALEKEIRKTTKGKPCVVFIDEVDALAKTRGNGMGVTNEERENTLNELLQLMDGFQSMSNVLWVAATNRADILDPAFLRRMDKKITFSLPDLSARIDLLKIYTGKTKRIRIDDEQRIAIARGIPGFSGDDIKNLIEEAGRIARKEKRKYITYRDIDKARDRKIMGWERKNLLKHILKEELSLTAYHECGHALVGSILPDCDPVHKITMIPHGQALGMVVSLPEREKHSWNLKAIKAHLAKLMAGRAAEMIIAGEEGITSGASADIAEASKIARSLVAEWGMSKEYGILAPRIGLQGELQESQNREIDKIAKNYIHEALTTAQNIIQANRTSFEAIYRELMEKETLTGKEVRAIIAQNAPEVILNVDPDEETAIQSIGQIAEDM